MSTVSYPPLKVRRLGILLRAHREHRWLPRIFKQIRELTRGGRHVTVCASLDRPSADVIREFEKFERAIRQKPLLDLVYHEPSLPVLSPEHGERWMHNLQEQYDALRSAAPVQAGMVWDDDMLFTDEGLRELRGHLESLAADRCEALSLFMWDAENEYNPAILTHWSTVLFRCYPGDQFPTDFVVPCPERVSRQRAIQLQWPIRNYGWLDQVARDAAWERAKQCGRIDAFTLHLQAPAEPVPYQSERIDDLLHVH